MKLPLTWNYVGMVPSSYTLKLDGMLVADQLKDGKFTLDLAHAGAGKHSIQLVANGVHTYFDLDPQRLTVKSPTPLPVESMIEINLEAR